MWCSCVRLRPRGGTGSGTGRGTGGQKGLARAAEEADDLEDVPERCLGVEERELQVVPPGHLGARHDRLAGCEYCPPNGRVQIIATILGKPPSIRERRPVPEYQRAQLGRRRELKVRVRCKSRAHPGRKV